MLQKSCHNVDSSGAASGQEIAIIRQTLQISDGKDCTCSKF